MTETAAARIRAWRNQLDADIRAAFTRGGRPAPEPLYQPDEEVPCRYGCGTDLRADDGTELPLLLADIDAVLEELEQFAQERDGDVRAVHNVLRGMRGDYAPGVVRMGPKTSAALSDLDARFRSRITELAAHEQAGGNQ